MVKGVGRFSNLLENAGYSEGDFMGQASWHAPATRSTTNNTYTSVHTGSGEINVYVTWDDLFPASVTTQATFFGELRANGDQVDVRLQNKTDNETVVEQTGTTGDYIDFDLGPTDYRPTTTAGHTQYQVQIRNSDGATSVSLTNPTFVFGVKL